MRGKEGRERVKGRGNLLYEAEAIDDPGSGC